jgi:hypothetical protein
VASCLSGITHSFVVSKKGVFTSFDPAGAISSLAATVIPSGAVVGAYPDSGGVGHGYLRSHGTFTTIDFPGAIFTFIGGSNPEGDSVGEYIDTAGVAHSFLLSNGVFRSFDPPGTGPNGSDATGINPGGVICWTLCRCVESGTRIYPDTVSQQNWPQFVGILLMPLTSMCCSALG